MSTKTMRLPPRRVVTTSNNKRKDQEEEDGRLDAVKLSSSKKPKTEPAQDQAEAQAQLGSASNQLLAGYLAHEFLTKGTLFGQPWEAARAEAASGSTPEPCSVGGEGEPERRCGGGEAELREGAEPPCSERLQRYVAVADLIGADGSHLPGVVNPSQLARLLQL